MRIIEKIREKVRERDYFISSHAEEEMMDDGLERADVEAAIREGKIEKRLTRDPRGTRYRIQGPAQDGRMIYVICRFNALNAPIIITVYRPGEKNEM